MTKKWMALDPPPRITAVCGAPASPAARAAFRLARCTCYRSPLAEAVHAALRDLDAPETVHFPHCAKVGAALALTDAQ